MKKILLWLAFGILLIPQSLAQITANKTGNAKAGCVANSGSMKISNVTITCRGIPRRDLDKLLKMLNELLRDQDTIEPKLYSIQVQLDEINQAVSTGSLGNLRARALALAREIADYLIENDASDPSKRERSPESREKLHSEWGVGVDNQFVFQYWNQVKAMQEEFASHGFRDEDLDEIIKSGDEALAVNRKEHHDGIRRNPEDQTTVVNGAGIIGIAEAFRRLALQLPQRQLAP